MTEEEYRKLANEMFGLDEETDPEVQKEMDLLAALNKKYANEITEEDTDQVNLEELYKKKQQ